MLCRRPRSTLIAALAGTVLLTALLVRAIVTAEPSPTPAIAAPQMASQPLAELGGGRTVREIHQDTPSRWSRSRRVT